MRTGAGRETCPPSALNSGRLDIDRDILMQSQIIDQNEFENKKQREEEMRRNADPYYEMRIAENDKDEDIQCDVCLEHEYDDDDLIVVCGLCNAAVHQTC
jgi:hypothetical protein